MGERDKETCFYFRASSLFQSFHILSFSSSLGLPYLQYHLIQCLS